MPSELLINHVGNALFEVYAHGLPRTRVELVLPDKVFLPGGKTLSSELRWYLEDYITSPFGAYAERAERLLSRLGEWGGDCYSRLFPSGIDTTCNIIVQANSPLILALPWDALFDGKEFIGVRNIILRRIGSIAPAVVRDVNRDKHKKHILLIVARPLGENDVKYLNIANPLIDVLQRKHISAEIDLLRPPTLSVFIKTLQKTQYDIVLFDCHGTFNETENEGHLLFETSTGEPDIINAATIGDILRRKNIHLVFLNSCRSAMSGKGNEANSIAAEFIKCGIDNVIAMGYDLHIQGAEAFVTGFFENLATTGDINMSLLRGKQQMLNVNLRRHISGDYALNDWLIPTIYGGVGTENFRLPIDNSNKTATDNPNNVPTISDRFVGRDMSFLQLERAFMRDETAILIHGMMGIGKTTLASAFVKWLYKTSNQYRNVFWFNFESIRSSEYVLNTIGDEIFGNKYRTFNGGEQLELLTTVLRGERYVIVWDNFESATGMPGTNALPHIPTDDYKDLRRFLVLLRGGKTKVIITSRKPNEFDSECVYKIKELTGLKGDELAAYCAKIANDTGFVVDEHNHTDYMQIIERLQGVPMLLRAILPQLSRYTPAELLSNINKNLLADVEGLLSYIQSALSIVIESTDKKIAPVFAIIGINERYFDTLTLKYIFNSCGYRKADERVGGCVKILTDAGLVSSVSKDTFEIHLAAREYLRKVFPATDKAEVAFVKEYEEMMYSYHSDIIGEHLDRVENVMKFALSELYKAMGLAEKHCLNDEYFFIANNIAAYHYAARNYAEAWRINEDNLIKATALAINKQIEFAHHELGNIASQRHDLDLAEKHYQTALNILESKNPESDQLVNIHFQLGRLYQDRGAFLISDNWYRLAFAEHEKAGNIRGIAMTNFQIARLNEDARNYEVAKEYYDKALKAFKKQNDAYGVADVFYQLGSVEFELGDTVKALYWYKRAREIAEELKIYSLLESVYRELGSLAIKEKDYTKAERFIKLSLSMTERVRDEFSSAQSYNNLGVIANENGDYALSNGWYKKAIAVFEFYNEESKLADLYFKYAENSIELHRFSEAERMLNKALALFKRFGRQHDIGEAYTFLAEVEEERDHWDKARAYCNDALKIFKELNDDYWISLAIHELGMIECEMENYKLAETLYLEALQIQEKLGNKENIAASYQQLSNVYYFQDDYDTAEYWVKKSLDIEKEFGNKDGIARSYLLLGNIYKSREVFPKAKEFYEKSHELFIEIDDEYYIAETKAEIANILLELWDIEAAIKLFKESISTFLAYADEQNAADYLNTLAIAYADSGDYENAKIQYTQAIELFRKIGDRDGEQTAYENLQEVLRMEHLKQNGYGRFDSKQELIDFCLSFPFAYDDYPFDNITNDNMWTVMRHRASKKMFAAIYERNNKLCVNLKCEPLEADVFRQIYADVTPAYHMNKIHWNTVTLGGDVPIEELKKMIEISYNLIKPRIRKG